VPDRREVLAAMTEHNAAHYDSVIMSSHRDPERHSGDRGGGRIWGGAAVEAGLPAEAGQPGRSGTATIAVYPQHGVLDVRIFPVVT
jgi:hypothetical protein